MSFWQNILCKSSNIELTNAKNQISALNSEITKLQQLNDQLKLDISKYQLPQETIDLINFYDSKYENKTITYAGDTIRTKELGVLNPSIKVCDYIHTTQSMKDWIESKGLTFKDLPTSENISKHCWKIYSEFVKNTRYTEDIDLYGENEKWISNFEQMYVKKGNIWYADCENFANLCLGLILASGVPRGLARCFAGECKLSGHCSLSVWDWRTKGFEQWETTARVPKVVKTNEDIYISRVWFSYDNEKSFTTLDKTIYDKIKVSVKLKEYFGR